MKQEPAVVVQHLNVVTMTLDQLIESVFPSLSEAVDDAGVSRALIALEESIDGAVDALLVAIGDSLPIELLPHPSREPHN